MKYLDCTTMYLPFLCRELGYHPTVVAQCITCTDDGEPIAGVIYDAYNGVSITAHIWIKDDRRPSRAWYAAIFDYPFNRLGCRKLLGQVASENVAAQKLDQHLGFVETARVPDYSEDGDLILYTMTKDQCRVLNSPVWTKSVEYIKRIA